MNNFGNNVFKSREGKIIQFILLKQDYLHTL